MKKFSRRQSLLLILVVLAVLVVGYVMADGPAAQAPGAAPSSAPSAAPSTVPEALPSAGPSAVPEALPSAEPAPEPASTIDEDGVYSSAEDVALYIHLYGHLPSNFITKTKARDGGWEGGSLEPYFPDMCIGGDRFGNREGLLPDAKGRKWTECDINTLHASSRGAERLVFSNDGLIYYTGDHYESFQLLYDADGPVNN